MGLTTWKKAPDGRVQKSDTIVAKNYLSDKEVSELNSITIAFLEFAELRAKRHILTNMADWKQRLEQFFCPLWTITYKIQQAKFLKKRRVKKHIASTRNSSSYKTVLFISDFDRYNDGNELLPFDINPDKD